MSGWTDKDLNISAADGTGKIGLAQIAKDAYNAIEAVTQIRSSLMTEIKKVATSGTASGTNKDISIGGVSIDISTGAGALVLDDALQELSTLEQAAAQLVAAENKAQKQVHSVTGQG
jgi:hypothetical protein